MATETLPVTGVTLGTISVTSKKVYLLQQDINMDSTSPAIDNGDVVNSILLPIDSTVICTVVEVLTGADYSTAATVDVAIGATVTVNDMNINRTTGAATSSLTNVTVSGAGHYVTVTPTFTGTKTRNGKLRLSVVAVQL